MCRSSQVAAISASDQSRPVVAAGGERPRDRTWADPPWRPHRRSVIRDALGPSSPVGLRLASRTSESRSCSRLALSSSAMPASMPSTLESLLVGNFHAETLTSPPEPAHRSAPHTCAPRCCTTAANAESSATSADPARQHLATTAGPGATRVHGESPGVNETGAGGADGLDGAPHLLGDLPWSVRRQRRAKPILVIQLGETPTAATEITQAVFSHRLADRRQRATELAGDHFITAALPQLLLQPRPIRQLRWTGCASAAWDAGSTGGVSGGAG